MDFVIEAAPRIKSRMDIGINRLQGQVKDRIDQAIADIGGTVTVGGYEQSQKPSDPLYANALSNNIVYNGLLDNAAGARLQSATLQAQAGDMPAFDQFLQKLTTFVDTTEATDAFAKARDYFQKMGSQPDRIFTEALAGLLRVLEGVIHAALSGAQAVIDALLDLTSSVVALLKTIMNEVWDIPFVSKFYTWLTATKEHPSGNQLTTVDIIALVVATPVTALYKVTNSGAAPFPDENSVIAFKSSFNYHTLLQASGLGSAAERRDSVLTSALMPRHHAVLLGMSSGVCTCLYGGFTSIIDLYLPPKYTPPGQPPDQKNKQPATAMLYCALGLEWAWQTFSCPWWTSPIRGFPGCNTADDFSKWMWIYQWLSCVVDTMYVIGEDRMPESESIGAAGFMVYGAIHMILAVAASTGGSAVVYAGNIIPTIPEIMKILRFLGIVEATGGVSLLVLAGSEFLLYTTSGIITVVLAAEPSS
jgi:disulfide bond formation protein DsbB